MAAAILPLTVARMDWIFSQHDWNTAW